MIPSLFLTINYNFCGALGCVGPTDLEPPDTLTVRPSQNSQE